MLELVGQSKLFEDNRRLSPVGGIIGVESKVGVGHFQSRLSFGACYFSSPVVKG